MYYSNGNYEAFARPHLKSSMTNQPILSEVA